MTLGTSTAKLLAAPQTTSYDIVAYTSSRWHCLYLHVAGGEKDLSSIIDDSSLSPWRLGSSSTPSSTREGGGGVFRVYAASKQPQITHQTSLQCFTRQNSYL